MFRLFANNHEKKEIDLVYKYFWNSKGFVKKIIPNPIVNFKYLLPVDKSFKLCCLPPLGVYKGVNTQFSKICEHQAVIFTLYSQMPKPN